LRSYVIIRPIYLVGDLDEQDKDEENKQVVKDTDCSDDDVDDLDVTNLLKHICTALFPNYMTT